MLCERGGLTVSVQALSCAFAIRGISSSEKLVLLALANFANDKMECWPSQERIAADTELSERTVWAALNRLEALGLLSRERRNRADGTRSTDRFTLHFSLTIKSEPLANPAKATRKSCESQSQSLQEPVATVATLTTFEPSIEEPSVKEERASRLPPDWMPDPADVLTALDKLGADRAATELDKFRDYWRAVPGAKGRKLDWSATFRNWTRRAAESSYHANRPDRHAARLENYDAHWAGADGADQVLAARRAL
jgi:DNA-binding MarR family transcriptional regulator